MSGKQTAALAFVCKQPDNIELGYFLLKVLTIALI
jgi:hypothetical protein